MQKCKRLCLINWCSCADAFPAQIDCQWPTECLQCVTCSECIVFFLSAFYKRQFTIAKQKQSCRKNGRAFTSAISERTSTGERRRTLCAVAMIKREISSHFACCECFVALLLCHIWSIQKQHAFVGCLSVQKQSVNTELLYAVADIRNCNRRERAQFVSVAAQLFAHVHVNVFREAVTRNVGT